LRRVLKSVRATSCEQLGVHINIKSSNLTLIIDVVI